MTDAFDPITEGFGSNPPTYSLGWSLADKVTIEPIKRRTADNIYKNHHSYIARGRQGYHYGVMLDGSLVGAITFDAWPSQSSIRGYKSAKIREVARVCIVNESPNLASCAMAHAQDTFIAERGEGIELLVTYIREDYKGTMFKALQSKGWEYDGDSKGHAPGNRQKHEIHNYDKERWVCKV
ncbi:hypothetical protein M196_gp19 [Halorubrum tailed virus 4]|uniref:Uncharacterized protein n=1 Tax=Halorubrum tailed virus 4 TaxID=1273752 RepID=R4TLT1_9CAUD|nr:hypothetical protein M196_gp19 [Halorubrum tailed virus 4]AGM11113.1 hypothetical protein HRTV4_19 [Halorubrum tailed virus 4]